MEHNQSIGEQNLEEDIDSMLIRVLKDDFDDDEISCTSYVSNFMKLDLNEAEFPSFLQNQTQRKDRRALTQKENANTQRIKEIIKRNMEVVREENEYVMPDRQQPLPSLNRNSKKFHTVKINNIPGQFEVNNLYNNSNNIYDDMHSFNMGGYHNNMSTSINLSNSYLANPMFSPSKEFSQKNRKYTNSSVEMLNFENMLRGTSYTDNSLRNEETNFQSLMFNNNTGLSNNALSPTFKHSSYSNNNINTSQYTFQDPADLEQFIENVLRHAEKIDDQSYFKLKGHFLKIVRTQNGSRYLQKSVKKTTKEILTLILDELLYHIQELILDQYANYFCPKFYGFLKLSDRVRYLNQLGPYIPEISKDKVGTYPIQAVIENLISIDEKKIVFSFLYENLINLALDHNGIHVVEKIFICFGDDFSKAIYELILKNFVILANSTSGLCIIKKIISYSESLEINNLILQKLNENFLVLVQNPFGNYSIQQAIDHWPYYLFMKIVEQLENRFVNLSMQKYSSNVVEKCLEKGGDIVVNAYIEEVISTGRIIDLLKNNYGNYVVLKALKLSSGMNRMKLISAITTSMEKLGDRKLVLKWKGVIETSLFELNASAMRQTELSNSHLSSDCTGGNPFFQHNKYNNESINSGSSFYNKEPHYGWHNNSLNNVNRTFSKSHQKFKSGKVSSHSFNKRSGSSENVSSFYFDQC